MSGTTRNLWVGTLHECGAIHESTQKLTKHRFESREQHCESGESRQKRDAKDVKVLKEQLNQFNLFDLQDSRLQNIFTGISADNNDGVNCDQAESSSQPSNYQTFTIGQNPCNITTIYQSQW